MKRLIALLIFLLFAAASFVIFTPYPSSFIIKKLFEGGVAVSPANYDEIREQVVQYDDLTYPSQFDRNTLDIISPKEAGTYPTIIWVHGGAFAAGDKSDITEYAVQIAQKGYHIVNMNYALAPEAKYPTPLLQLAEVYAYVRDHAEQYQFDLEQIYFAGDSAGAQIVSQFANVQTNPVYAKKVAIKAVIDPTTIKGLLLFCGPYDIQKLAHLSDNAVVRFLLDRVAWGYIDERDWHSSEIAQLASPLQYITPNYPPSFITDGNEMTFDDHGKTLVKVLQDNNVQVDYTFYDEPPLPHEYQFMMDRPQAVETFEAVVQFLQATSQHEQDKTQ